MSVTFEHAQFALCSPNFYPPDRSGSIIQQKAARLVAELQRVGWNIPGIDVHFRTYGKGRELIRVVDRISGMTGNGPFSLSLGGTQGRLERYSVCNQLDEAVIPPGIVLKTYDDRSSTAVSKYIGRDWKSETPETIRYVGRDKFKNENELRPPNSADLKTAMQGVDDLLDWLLDQRLARLSSQPGFDDVNDEGDLNLRRLAAVERIPVPEGFPTLYARLKRQDASERARSAGLKDADVGDDGYYAANEDYVLDGNGWRAGTSSAEGPIPRRAYDGFDYATTDISDNRGHPVFHSYEAVVPVEVKLDCLNDIFVMDTAAYDERRARFFEEIKAEGRDSMTDHDLDMCVSAAARTMVPAAEYDGSFRKPVYLIGRQMDRNEARIMHGPMRVVEGESTNVVATDAKTGKEFFVFEGDPMYKKESLRAARAMESMQYVFDALEAADAALSAPETAVAP